MENTRVHQLLSSLSAIELNRLDKFLRSPYFNEDAQLLALLRWLLPFYKNAAKEMHDKEKLWRAVMGRRPFSALKYSRLLSDMARKVEQFSIHDQLRNDEARQLRHTARLLNEKKLTQHFPKTLQLLRKKVEQQPLRDSDFHLQLFRIEAQHHHFLELGNQRSTEKNLLQSMQALDAFYLAEKLNYLAAVLHYKNFLALEGEVPLMRELLEHLQSTDYAHLPAVHLPHLVVLTLMKPEEEQHFSELKKQLAKHSSVFRKSQARNFYAFAINYCIRKINFGNTVYLRELFLLYKQMLQVGLMTDEEDVMSQFDYKNIVTVALRVNETKWAERFIAHYQPQLKKEERQNAYTFNLARLHFHRKEFAKVLPLLQDVQYTDIFYQLDSKTTLLKTYYELGEYLPMMALKESFRILLRRKKVISEQNRTNYLHFTRFMMRLYRLDVKDKNKLAALKKELLAATNVADKSWLLEKLSERGG